MHAMSRSNVFVLQAVAVLVVSGVMGPAEAQKPATHATSKPFGLEARHHSPADVRSSVSRAARVACTA